LPVRLSSFAGGQLLFADICNKRFSNIFSMNTAVLTGLPAQTTRNQPLEFQTEAGNLGFEAESY
jgi:hypothetical protein